MASEIPWTGIKALSFDIYGTLIDWETGIYNTARESALGPFLPGRSEALNGIDDHDVQVQAEHPEMLQSEVIAEGLRRYAKDLKVVESGKLSQEEVDKATKAYGSKIGQYPAFQDTVRAIQTLAKYYKLVPLSNVDRASFSETLSGPLRGCNFDAVYTAQDIGSYKPDLKNFHYLLDHVKSDFGIGKSQLLHVAQSLFHDHRPAKQMGIQSVWIDRKGLIGEKTHGKQNQEEYGYALRVETLGELAAIVEEAFSKA